VPGEYVINEAYAPLLEGSLFCGCIIRQSLGACDGATFPEKWIGLGIVGCCGRIGQADFSGLTLVGPTCICARGLIIDVEGLEDVLADVKFKGALACPEIGVKWS